MTTTNRPRRSWIAALLFALAVSAAAAAEKDAWRDPSAEKWIEVRSDHFRVFSNGGERRMRELTIQLEGFREALSRLTKGFEVDASVPTAMFVFRNDATYTPYKLDESGNPLNFAGYFQPTPFKNFITLDASASDYPMGIVYHEYVHAVMNASLGELPLWLGEGLAEYYSTFTAKGFDTRIEIGHGIGRHLAYLRSMTRLSWEEVFATTHDSPAYNESERQGAFYAQSWLLVHYLASTDEGAKGLGRYLTKLREGADPTATLPVLLGSDRASLAVALDQYRKRKLFAYQVLDVGRAGAETELSVREMERAEVLYQLGDLLAHSRNRTDATRHLEAARAAGYPTGPIEASLGYSAYAAEMNEEAQTHFRRAVDAGADTPEPYTLLARAILEPILSSARVSNTGLEVPPEIAEARRLLSAGLERNPNDFYTLLALASTYEFDRDAAAGLAAIDRARAQRPLDVDVAALRACLLAGADRAADAWSVVREAIAPRNERRARETEDCIESSVLVSTRRRLDADDRAGALRVLGEAIAAAGGSPSARQLVELRNVLESGGSLTLLPPTDSAEAQRLAEAVRLANGGKLAEALAELELLSEISENASIKLTAADLGAKLREALEQQRLVDLFNEAVELANRGERKEAIVKLRALEPQVEDPPLAEAIQSLLKDLGAKPPK